jgi:GntR family transcriptional regulator
MFHTSGLSTKALYLQVRDMLAQRITTGEWKAGLALPNEAELALAVGVSLGTMRKALKILEAEKLVTRRGGRGTSVNDPTSDEVVCRFIRMRTADGESCSG